LPTTLRDEAQVIAVSKRRFRTALVVIMLQRGAQLSVRVSLYVQGLIAAILRFFGRTTVAGASLTVTCIRWVFEALFAELRSLARAAVRMPR